MQRNNATFILVVFIIIAILLSGFGIYASEQSGASISARAGALFDPVNERFLYTKNINERLYMASTTKIATALVAIESLPLDKIVEIPKEAVGIEGSSAYLKEGEKISVEGLLFALLLRSANDAAVALAIEVSGSIENFALLMNERASAIGLADTNFKNPHGLHDNEHYTTAHDLAILCAEAMKNDTFCNIVKEKTHKVITNFTTHIFANHNKLLLLFDGACGVKTGYTKNAGRCLVGAAKRDGVTLISVTLDAPTDWSDHSKMLEYGFSLLEKRVLLTPNDFNYTLPVLDAKDGTTVTVAPANALSAQLLKTEETPIADVLLPNYLVAPLEIGDEVGKIVFKNGEKVIATVALTVKENVPKQERKGFLKGLKDIFTKSNQRKDE